MKKIAKGTWVEIEDTVLLPEQRATNIPEDTRATPLFMRVSGFLMDDAEIGSQARVRTIIGRELSGRLRVENPSYSHSFGTTVPELLTIGTGVEQ